VKFQGKMKSCDDVFQGMFFKGNLTIFPITCFYNYLDNETWRMLRIHIKVPMVQISASGLLHFWRYILWKIGFLTSPITSLKHVFRVKKS
jgi:hypothetical protein